MIRYTNALILLILSCTIFSACKDPVEIRDTSAPKITIITPIEGQRVSGMITIEATAEDQDTDLSMQVFVDGKLVDEGPGQHISVQFDTKALTEGTHAIKVTATDKARNSGQKTVNIEVRNVLFIAHVPSNYVSEYTQIYFALSRNDGSLIAVNEVHNNGTVVVPTPSNFNLDSSFVFTEYVHLSMGDAGPNVRTQENRVRMTAMNTYAGLYAGEFYLPAYEVVLPVIGTHEVTITEVPTDHFAALSGSNAESVSGNFGNSGVIKTELGLKKNTSDFYFQLRGVNEYWEPNDAPPPTYNYIKSIEIGGSTLFSFTELPQMPKVEMTTPDNAGFYQCAVYNESAGSLTNSLFGASGLFDNGKIPVYYPAKIYPKYIFNLQYQIGSTTYQNLVRAATPPLSFQKLNAAVSNVNYLNRKLNVTSTGTFDMVTISGLRGGTFVGDLFSIDFYSVSFPNGTKNQIIIPAVPAELLALEFTSPDDLVFDNTALYDYSELSGSNDYQHKIVFNSDNAIRQMRDFIGTFSQITTTSSGGRLSTQKKVILPKELETILQRHVRLGEFDLSH